LDGGARASFVWEKTGVPGENPRGRAGNDLTFPQTTLGRIGEKRLQIYTCMLLPYKETRVTNIEKYIVSGTTTTKFNKLLSLSLSPNPFLKYL